jgi:hypothetical protein
LLKKPKRRIINHDCKFATVPPSQSFSSVVFTEERSEEHGRDYDAAG